MYKQLDYIIQIDAPFKERENRVFQRDNILKKGMMVIRDKEFKNSLKRNNKRAAYINKKINNTGSIEDLQKIADEIYFEIIDNNKKRKKKETVRERYRWHKTKPIDMTKIASRSKTRESDKTK